MTLAWSLAAGSRRPSPDQVEGISPKFSVVPALPGSGGGQLSQASSQVPVVPSTPLVRPGSGGVDLGLALDLEDTFPDGSSRANPGAPTSQFRTAVAREVGRFLRRALDGGHLRSSGRSALNLSSRYYVVLCDFQGRRCAEPCIFSSFGPCKNLCCRGPGKGRSIFVGLPSQTEVAEALRAADLSWPSEGLDVQPRTVGLRSWCGRPRQLLTGCESTPLRGPIPRSGNSGSFQLRAQRRHAPSSSLPRSMELFWFRLLGIEQQADATCRERP